MQSWYAYYCVLDITGTKNLTRQNGTCLYGWYVFVRVVRVCTGLSEGALAGSGQHNVSVPQQEESGLLELLGTRYPRTMYMYICTLYLVLCTMYYPMGELVVELEKP